jgi:hypothetical protein
MLASVPNSEWTGHCSTASIERVLKTALPSNRPKGRLMVIHQIDAADAPRSVGPDGYQLDFIAITTRVSVQ